MRANKSWHNRSCWTNIMWHSLNYRHLREGSQMRMKAFAFAHSLLLYHLHIPFLSVVYTSVPLTHCAICVRRVSGAWLINFPRTWSEQGTPWCMERTPGASSSLCVCAKFWFATNSMRTVCGWRSAGSQCCPHIRAFGSQTVRKYSASSCIRGFRQTNAFVRRLFGMCVCGFIENYSLPQVCAFPLYS